MAVILEAIMVDLSRLIAGPYSAMTLADLGVRVIRTEALAGEDGRRMKGAAHWVSAFSDADISSGRVNTVSQAMADPHLTARFVFHPQLPRLPMMRFPAHLVEGMLAADRDAAAAAYRPAQRRPSARARLRSTRSAEACARRYRSPGRPTVRGLQT